MSERLQKKMKLIISLVTIILINGCSSEINVKNDELKLFAYAESPKQTTFLTLSTDEQICSGNNHIAFSTTFNNKNQIQVKKYFCWDFNESKELVNLYETNFIKLKVQKIDVNNFVLIKTKEQLALEKFHQNFENFIRNERRIQESSKNHLGVIKSIIDGEPKACLFIGNILNCE